MIGENILTAKISRSTVIIIPVHQQGFAHFAEGRTWHDRWYHKMVGETNELANRERQAARTGSSHLTMRQCGPHLIADPSHDHHLSLTLRPLALI